MDKESVDMESWLCFSFKRETVEGDFLDTKRVKKLSMHIALTSTCLTEKSQVSAAQWCHLFGDPMSCSLPGSAAHGFSRQEYWSVLPFPTPGDLSYPGIEPGSLCIVDKLFTIWTTREAP